MSRIKGQQYLCDLMGITLPYHQMGKIDSYHLFGLETEMMLFALYKHNKDRWHNVLDIGANIGLHSILMAKLGWNVTAYEPDPATFWHMTRNLVDNASKVNAVNKAVHIADGKVSFVRVLNNLTGSHIAGFKESYGPRDTIEVQAVDCRNLWPGTDFAKIDCEGNEAELALTMTSEVMSHMSCVMEVRNDQNAKVIYDHFKDICPIWAQKIDWQPVQKLEDMPKMNREGSIFIGHTDPWTTKP